MARTPRPVDPDEGPVQAFAFDLRALRESAGNPTYRTLAKTAGYSATTLGDAAGGAHLPTLEVALAYVGACGGDVAAWRERWQNVSRAVAQERAQRTAGSAKVDVPGGEAAACADEPGASELSETPESVSESEPPARARVHISSPWLVIVAALSGVLIAALVGVVVARQPGAEAATSQGSAASERATAADSEHCPALPADGAAVAFTGTTYGLGANVRSGASLESQVRLRIPPGCAVAFSGYCLGDVVMDETAGTPDMRWFIIPGVGEVASAIVHGDPPAGLQPRPCPQDVPAPAAITLAIARTGTGGGVVELSATGSRLWIVGFAAYYPDTAGASPRWHQLGFGDDQSGGSFDSAPLRLAADPAARVPVVAVACLGGGGPTAVAAYAEVSASTPPTLRSVGAPTADTLATAARTACQYPSG